MLNLLTDTMFGPAFGLAIVAGGILMVWAFAADI